MISAIARRITLMGDLDRLITIFLFGGYVLWPIYIFQVAQIGSFPVIISMACLGVAMLLWIVRFIIGKQPLEWSSKALWVAVICIAVLLSEISLIVQGAPSSHSVLSAMHLFFYAGAAIVWASENHTPRLFINVFRVQIYFGAAICLFGIYQIFARLYDLPFAWLEMSNVIYSATDQLSLRFANFFRATSIFSEPSALAYYCVQILVVLGIAACAKQEKLLIRSKFLRITIVLLYITTLFLTYSLGGILTGILMLAGIVLFLRGSRRWFVFRNAVLGLLFMVAVDLILLKPVLGLSVSELAYKRMEMLIEGRKTGYMMPGESYEKRMRSVSTGARVWEKFPVFGAGLGRYGEMNNVQGEKFNDTFYFSALAELGLVGTAVVILAMASLVAALFRTARHYPSNTPEWMVLQVCAFLLIFVAITGWAYSFLYSEAFWLNMGAGLVFLKKLSPAGGSISLASLKGDLQSAGGCTMERPILIVKRKISLET